VLPEKYIKRLGLLVGIILAALGVLGFFALVPFNLFWAFLFLCACSFSGGTVVILSTFLNLR